MSLPNFNFLDDVGFPSPQCTSTLVQETQNLSETTSVSKPAQQLTNAPPPLPPPLSTQPLSSAIDSLSSFLSIPEFPGSEALERTIPLPSPGSFPTAPAPSAAVVLDRALSLPNRATWLSDFLFADAPSVDLAMLTPHSLDAAICANIAQSSMEISGTHGGAHDSNAVVQWAIIPSFCIGDITCGITVAAQQVTPTASLSPTICDNANLPREYSIGRFLRDERTSEFVLYRSETDPSKFGTRFNSLIHMALRKSTGRERTYMRFRDTASGEAPQPSHVEYMQVSTEQRFCPACNSGPSANCDCKLASRSPSHPHDFCWSTMANHCGDFNGHAVSTIISGSRTPITAHMITRCLVRGGSDKSIVAALTNWAINNRMASVRPSASLNFMSPTNLVMNAGETLTKVLDEAAQGLRVVCVPKPLSPAIKPASIMPIQDTSTVTRRQYMAYVQGGAGSETVADANWQVNMHGTSLTGKSAEDLEKASRKHRRKLRNRMAAARSNLRRKENYENLQRDVASIRERKVELERKLELLREENSRLRAKIEL